MNKEHDAQQDETNALGAFVHNFVSRSPHVHYYVLITFDKSGHPALVTNTNPNAVHKLLHDLSHGGEHVDKIEEIDASKGGHG